MSVLPDPEALLVAALRARSDGWSCGQRISTRLSGTYPALRVTLVGGPPRPVEGTGRHLLQWEAWASGDSPADEVVASDLARQVEAVSDSLRGVYSSGTIVASWADGGFFASPDGTTNRARQVGVIGLITQ